MISDHFNILISKFKKNKKKYYFNIFLKNYTLKNNYYHILKHFFRGIMGFYFVDLLKSIFALAFHDSIYLFLIMI